MQDAALCTAMNGGGLAKKSLPTYIRAAGRQRPPTKAAAQNHGPAESDRRGPTQLVPSARGDANDELLQANSSPPRHIHTVDPQGGTCPNPLAGCGGHRRQNLSTRATKSNCRLAKTGRRFVPASHRSAAAESESAIAWLLTYELRHEQNHKVIRELRSQKLGEAEQVRCSESHRASEFDGDARDDPTIRSTTSSI